MKHHRSILTIITFVLVITLFGVGPGANTLVALEGDNVATAQGATPAEYKSKNEIVYANLSGGGLIEDVYIVNEFEVSKSGILKDFGEYTEVMNLSSEAKISNGNSEILIPVEQGQFFYQGTPAKNSLPWIFEIAYFLDGKKIEPEDLSSKDGHVDISLKTTKNSDIDPVFCDNYMLQITLKLDSESSSNIRSEGATIANEGTNKTIVHTVLKGKDANISISADVKNFSMSGFEIAAMPFTMTFDLPETDELTGNMTTLSDAISAINDGVGELASGTADLNDGVSKIVDGSSAFSNGITSLSAGSGQLTNGSAQIKAALDQIASSLNTASGDMDLGDFNQLPATLRQMAQGLQGFASGLSQLKDGYAVMYSTLDSAILSIPDGSVAPEDIGDLNASLSPAQQGILSQLVDGYTSSQIVKNTYTNSSSGMSIQMGMGAITSGLDAIISGDGTASNPGLSGMAAGLNTMADGIETALNNNDMMAQIKQLTDGLNALASQYGAFHTGLKQYADGVDQIASEYDKLHGGLTTLQDGTDELADGTHKLHDGTTELNDEVADLPDTIQVEIDKLMEDYESSDFAPTSFASSQNVNIDLVQFVIMTSSIEKEKEKTTETKEEEKVSIWDRFLDLFR